MSKLNVSVETGQLQTLSSNYVDFIEYFLALIA